MADNQDGSRRGGMWGQRRAPLEGPLSAKPLPPSPHAPASPDTKVLPIKPGEPEGRQYKAFTTQADSHRLHLRAAFGPLRFPSYNYLMDILLAEDFSGITLIYTFMVVELTGQYLEPVAHAIAEKHCGRVTEFSPRFHDRPEAGEPYIAKITILADGIQKTGSDSKKP